MRCAADLERSLMPGSAWARAGGILLRLYLASALAGCAGSRPEPGVPEARAMETRAYDASLDATFRAAVSALQDLKYTVDLAEVEGGVITASRETGVELAEISEEAAPAREGGMPTWEKVLLIGTGVILVVALIGILSGGGKDESTANADESENHGGRHDDHGSTTIVQETSPSGPTIYRYRVTLSLRSLGPSRTEVRVSAQGSEVCGGAVSKAGPIHDEAFLDAIHGALDRSLVGED